MQLTPSRPASDGYLLAGVAFSALIHLFLAALLLTARSDRRPPHVEPIMVSLADLMPAAPKERQQIVTPPRQEPSLEAPDNARLLSDQNFRTDREQIRRGQEDAGLPGAGDGRSAAESQEQLEKSGGRGKTPVREQTRRSGERKEDAGASSNPIKRTDLHDLLLDPKELEQKFSKDNTPSDPLRLPAQGAKAEPFSRPLGAGARFLGAYGTSDYLPYLPDGDITLLNAKANQFAVFVRRVAVRVFSELRSSGWERLLASDVRGIARDCTVTAQLSLAGKLLSVSLDEGSGSPRFDSVLMGAVHRGTGDPNPPAEAAKADGTIGFIFKSRSWVQLTGDSRGNPMERRWLLLSTGLE